MKRDPRLHGLTSDHHQGLVLARRIVQGRMDAAEVRQRFDAELEPHFAAEEELLLPALEASAPELVARTRSDHEGMRAHLAAAERGDAASLAAFGALLDAHIRFEERELFPAAEAQADAEALDRIAVRKPHPRG
jgi:iron-sulfur cluster repair protein YtfE (RIC family)